MSVWVWLGVGVLGGVGALARVLTELALSGGGLRAGGFPYGTFAVNVSGSLLLGLLDGLGVGGDLLVLAGTATLGSYTTFSTWMAQTHRLAEDGVVPFAVLYLLLSLAVGFLAALLGRAMGLAL